MSTRTIRECDICGKEVPYETIYAIIGRRMDGAGSSEDVCAPVDLCPIHMRALMERMVEDMDYPTACDWSVMAKKKPVT